MECPYHEPLYTGVLGITNGILHHSYSKKCGKESQKNETLALRYIEVPP